MEFTLNIKLSELRIVLETTDSRAMTRRLQELGGALVALEHTTAGMLAEEAHMAGELARLTTEVSETKTIIDSAITLITSLADLIRQNATDPAALNALANDLDAKQAALATAIQANTPPAP